MLDPYSQINWSPPPTYVLEDKDKLKDIIVMSDNDDSKVTSLEIDNHFLDIFLGSTEDEEDNTMLIRIPVSLLESRFKKHEEESFESVPVCNCDNKHDPDCHFAKHILPRIIKK